MMDPPAFVLAPMNKNARAVVNAPENSDIRYGNSGLYVSFANEDKQEVTLGRYGADIYLPVPDRSGAEISKLQCSFVNNTKLGAVLLVDHSRSKNTEPLRVSHGGRVIPFPSSRSSMRSVLVARGINENIGIGKSNYYHFEIQWHFDGLYDFPFTDQNEPYHHVGPKNGEKKYIEGDIIGGGTYGTVSRALDVFSGEVFALKKFHNLQGRNYDFAKREVGNLFRINNSSIPHDHIIEIFGSADGNKKNEFEIFMPFKEGNLKTLVEEKRDDFSDVVLQQMLLALKCLAEHKLVHRDIKPENILWEFDEDGDYHFRLGDFGLSHDPKLARTLAGTEPFMAPEILNRQPQTKKVDIWSLFATIAWVRNAGGFRDGCVMKSPAEAQAWLVHIAATTPDLRLIRDMASIRPKGRPSARKLLRLTSKLPSAFLLLDDDEQLAAMMGPLDVEEDEDEDLVIIDPDDGEPGPSRSSGSHSRRERAEEEEVQPQVPWYESYQAYYDWKSATGSSASQQYQLPPEWNGVRNEFARVTPYGSPYGPREGNSSGSDTAVPTAANTWRERTLPTQPQQEAESSTRSERSSSKKHGKRTRK